MEQIINRPTKQDYVDIMFGALKQFEPGEYTTINLMTKYIMSKFENLTVQDEDNNRLADYETFLALKNAGYFKARKFNEYKLANKNLSEVKLVVEDKKIIDSKKIIVDKQT